MSRSLSFFILIAIAFPAGSRCQERTFFVTPLCSYNTYTNLGFDNGFNAGASVGVRVAPWLSASFALMFGSRTAQYDVVGGTNTLDARTVSYTIMLSTPLLGGHEGAELAAVLGGGALLTSVDARTISAGALGTIPIPPSSETRALALAGLSAALPLSSRIAFTLEPTVRLIAPMSSSTLDYSIAGGLRVGLF